MRVRSIRMLAATVLGAGFLTACGAQPSGPVVESNPCEFGASVFAVGPVAFCEHAVELAQDRLGWLHWPVTSIHFRLGLCPPTADCPEVSEDQGFVIFSFSMGDPSMIHVTTDPSGILIVGNQEAVPGWLRDQLQEQDQRPPQDAGG